MASAELERVRRRTRIPSTTTNHTTTTHHRTATTTSNNNNNNTYYESFPPACLAMLQNSPGNRQCMDCGARSPQWAAVSYGALLCLHCSGHHRALGVQVSTVRSIAMDHWSLKEVVSMLEGGNAQLTTFFQRHCLAVEAFLGKDNTILNKENVTVLRYKTKAAMFYRQQMELHVQHVLQAGPYRGREISRNLQRPSSSSSSTTPTRLLERRHTTIE
jgi:hypothetical protein